MHDSFPIDAALPELIQALAGHGRAVLTASPGSGKTTRVPLALLGLLPVPEGQRPAAPLPGKILILEPRRIATRAAARHMARLLGESVGERVGYRVRLESVVSDKTVVELLTEGMFTRRILADPELSGVSCVIFDEFHERGLHADLGLALCLESAAVFRPDLRLLIMSATLDAGDVSRFLGGCPVIATPGRVWPVAVRHAGRELAVGPASGPEKIARKTARAVCEALHGETGNILAFLPGQAEIRRTAALLASVAEDTDVYPLYGDLPAREQDAAIAPPSPGRRKVVLATDLAQTSLTIEGVRVVVDAGLARVPRFEPATGLSRLVTVRLAKDAADQRAGRAGRLEPGICLRLWSAQEKLAPQTRPEILDADIASLYLDALAWGSSPAALAWLTPPPEAALSTAAETLLALGAARADTDGRLAITRHGRRLARLPLHPRLAHMVLRAAEPDMRLASLAACLAALVSERDPLRPGAAGETSADIRLRLPLLRRPEHKRLMDAAGQIYRLAGLTRPFALPGPDADDCCGMLLSVAWPERIAHRRDAGSFRLASGQGAELPRHDPLAAEPFLAAANLGGGVNRRIRLAAPLAPADLERLHGEAIRHETQIFWDARSEAVIRRSVKRLGALILEEKPLPPAPERHGQWITALLEGIVATGLACLPWTEELRQLQARAVLMRRMERAGSNDENPWPDLTDTALLAGLKAGLSGDPEATWLSPWLEGISRRSQFSGIDLAAALRALLPWPLANRLEREAPAQLKLPSGSTARVDYLPALRGEPPVLAVKLQEMFGQTDTPRVAGNRVPVTVHLLSPAGRPVQVTADLRHFWNNAYADVRAEMRGRYPKHPWPEDPLAAPPTGKTKKRMTAPPTP